MGIYYNMMFGQTNIGFDFGHSLDLGANYKIPYYSERQYMILGTDLSLHVGMFTWLEILLPYLKTSVNLEVTGVKLVPSLRLLYDISTYTDMCTTLELYTRGLELLVTTSLSFMDCSVGAAGYFYELVMVYVYGWPARFGEGRECVWREYWFEKKPLVRVGVDAIKWWSKKIIDEQCLIRRKEAWEQQ
jgi:hypothetical protein